MKPKLRWKKGAVLLQTLVTSVLLSMIAVMVLKWVLARYTIASRVQRSSMANARTVGYANLTTSSWNFGAVPGSGGTNLPADSSPQNAISFTAAPAAAGQPRRVDVTYSED